MYDCTCIDGRFIVSEQNLVNMMQSQGNSELIYISDESPSVPQLSVFSKSPFEISDVSSNIGASLVDEIEMEDISDEVIVPVTPSPLLNNKRQQHITLGRGIKRTCLEKAFSTMSTSSNNCSNGVDMMEYNFPKQEEMFPENNSKSINGKESNIRTSVNGLSKNNAPSKGKEILSFPYKHSSKNFVLNSATNGISKQESSMNDAQDLVKPKAFTLRKRGTVIINSDSDDSTDNVAETSFRNVQSVTKFRNPKNHRNENKGLQKNLTMTEHCSLCNASSSESLFENCGLMTAKKLTNKYSGASLDTDLNNKGKSHICKELNYKHTGLHQNDVYSVSPNNRSLKNQVKLYKRSPKTTNRDHYHEQEVKYNTTTSFNNTKPSCSMNKTRSNSDKNGRGATNQRNSNASCAQVNTTASTSSKCENRVRRKHSHRGRIARYPVDDSDTDLEFYDAKSDFSDHADSKRMTKGSRKKKPQRRLRLEYLSSDSSSDVSVVSEKHFSPSNHRTAKQYVRNTESPDPVEQVRQMEEDERLAYMLQAQFDAELEGNNSNEEIDDFNSSILLNLSVDSASSSSDSSSSSSFSTAAAAETVFPFLVSSSISPRILRDINSGTLERTRRSTRLQQRQPSIIGWMPESVQTVLTAWMPNFAEDTTYESLLEITEQIGEESRGLKKQQINGLPTRKFSASHMSDSSMSGSSPREKQDCTICLCEYQNNDVIRSLPCCHEFHATCIDRWLKSHSTCPICRIEVSVQRHFGRKRKS